MTTTITTPTTVTTGSPSPAGNRFELGWALSDAAAMIGRSVRHSIRNTDALIMALVLPVMMMLLFVYVFGGAIETGTAYINYVVPGILLLTASFGSATTAVGVCNDMVSGIIDRFRSLPIVSSAVLTGHVAASVLRNLAASAVVVGVGLLMGFRPTAGPLEWLGVAGMVALFVLAISWVSAALGLLARTPEAASGFTFGFLFLPYVSSAFVPTDSMPTWLHAFAEHQPVTPIIETVRGLLTGTPIGDSWWLALVWFGGITLVAMAVAAAIFARRTTR